MTRDALNRQIHQLQDEVLLLGSMIEQATSSAMNALRQRDITLSRQIIEDDHLINEKRFAIENAILILIATQQPMAHDLRLMAAILDVISELERMGDYAKGIAKVVVRLEDFQLPIPIREYDAMAGLALNMLHRSLTAFIAENAPESIQIVQEDDKVDALYTQIYHFLVNAMIADPTIIDHANLLMWISHNLERLADRVSNICERTVFIATGELLELATNDEDDGE
jgi:phosphate transport system protein